MSPELVYPGAEEFFFRINFILHYCVCEYAHVTAHIQKSEANLRELVLSFHCGFQGIKLRLSGLFDVYPLTQFTQPRECVVEMCTEEGSGIQFCPFSCLSL